MRAALVVALCAGVAVAGPSYRVVSPKGKHYIIAREGAFELFLSDESQPLLLDEVYWGDSKLHRMGDTLLGAGRLSRPELASPRVLDNHWYWNEGRRARAKASRSAARSQWQGLFRVLDREAAFVSIGSTLRLITAKGRQRWEVTIAKASHTPFVIEQLGIVVAVIGKEIRAVTLDDGSVRSVSPRVLFFGARHGTDWERHSAIASCGDLLPAGTAEQMLRIVDDRRQEFDMRIHAAVVARRAGAEIDLKPLFRRMETARPSPHVISYAYEVLGAEALPTLLWLMRSSNRGDSAAQRGLVHVGTKAISGLSAIALDQELPRVTRIGATRAMAAIRSQEALPVLMELARGSDYHLANGGFQAATAIGGPSLPRLLGELLRVGSRVNDKIVYYFESHPSREAVAGLKAEMRRNPPTPSWRRRLTSALDACRRAR